MGTRHYLGGIVIDQQFRIEYLTRLTDSARLADFAYQGLPPFYPASWFWLGGRFANLLHLAGWAAYKPWAIETMAVAGAIVFPLWSLVTDRRRALLLAVTTSVIGLLLGAAEPYSWFASATIPPLLVLAWQLLTALRTSRPGDRPPTLMPSVVLGVFLGLYGMRLHAALGVRGVPARGGHADLRRAGHARPPRQRRPPHRSARRSDRAPCGGYRAHHGRPDAARLDPVPDGRAAGRARGELRRALPAPAQRDAANADARDERHRRVVPGGPRLDRPQPGLAPDGAGVPHRRRGRVRLVPAVEPADSCRHHADGVPVDPRPRDHAVLRRGPGHRTGVRLGTASACQRCQPGRSGD